MPDRASRSSRNRVNVLALIVVLTAVLILIGRAVAIGFSVAGVASEITPVSIETPVDNTPAPPQYLAPPEPTVSAKATSTPVQTELSVPVVLGIVLDAQSSTIVYVEPGSAAEKAGLFLKDHLIAWNGAAIGDLSQQQVFFDLKRTIESADATSKITITIERDGKQLDLPIIPEPFPAGPLGWDAKNGAPPTATPVFLPYLYL